MSNQNRVSGSTPARSPAFVGREPESLRFHQELDRYLRDTIDGMNLSAGLSRSNLVVITGISGVGKSGFVSTLRAWVGGDAGTPASWGELGYGTRQHATFALDASGADLTRAEDLLFKVRAQLAERGVSCDAFDIGLALWWQEFHPGFAGPSFKTKSGFDYAGQLGSTLDDLIGWSDKFADIPQLALGSLGVGLVTTAYQAIRDGRLRKKTLASCASLRELVEGLDCDGPVVGALDLASLMAWDLEQLDPHDRPIIVGFVDSTEYALTGNRARERALNALVGHMPFAFWVLSGQEPVPWGDDAYLGVVEFAGSLVWSRPPGDELALSHLRLEPLEDPEALGLARAWFALEGMPSVTEEDLLELAEAAMGSPAHIKLAALNARASHSKGRFQAADLADTFPQLAAQVVENLSPEHAQLLRHAALIAHFDADLLHRATGLAEGTCRDFCNRGVVEPPATGALPLRIHDMLRGRLSQEPPSVLGAWTPADRRAGALRLLDALEARAAETDKGDSAALLPLIGEAGNLCATFDIEADWIRVKASRLHVFSEVAEILPAQPPPSWIGDVQRLYACWSTPGTAHRIPRLQTVAASASDPRIRAMANRFTAYALKSGGRNDEAITLFRELLESPDAIASLRTEYLTALIQAEHFTTLANEMEVHGESLSPIARGQVTRGVAFAIGNIRESYRNINTAHVRLASWQTSRTTLNSLATHLLRACLAGDVTPDLAEFSRVRNQELRRSLSQRSAILSCLLLTTSEARARSLLTEAETLMARTNGFEGFREHIGACVIAARWSDPELASAAHKRATAESHSPSPNYRVAARFFTALGLDPLYGPADYGPYAQQEEVEERWAPNVERWLEIPQT